MERKPGKWKWEGVRRKMMGVINTESVRGRATPASFYSGILCLEKILCHNYR